MDSRNHNPIFPTFLFNSNLQESTQAFCIHGHYDVSTYGYSWHHELWPSDVIAGATEQQSNHKLSALCLLPWSIEIVQMDHAGPCYYGL